MMRQRAIVGLACTLTGVGGLIVFGALSSRFGLAALIPYGLFASLGLFGIMELAHAASDYLGRPHVAWALVACIFLWSISTMAGVLIAVCYSGHLSALPPLHPFVTVRYISTLSFAATLGLTVALSAQLVATLIRRSRD